VIARRRLSREAEDTVLLLCRRRCCICYGLNRDTGIKQGQIAHVDRDPANDDLDNLAFMCLDHHDQYDARAKQSKNLTMSEVRHFRRELHEAIDRAWKEPVRIGAIEVGPIANAVGHYVREGEFENAELDVAYLGKRRLRVRGFAFWGTTRQSGPNIGELDFEAELENDKLVFTDSVSGGNYRAELTFRENGLTVREDYVIGYFGMNVSFEGEYVKAE